MDIDQVEGVLELAQQALTTWVGERKTVHHTHQHLHVEAQPEHLVVAHRELGACEPVQRHVAGGVEVAEWRGLELRAQHRVGRRLDQEAERPHGQLRQGHAAATRMDALQRLTVEPHQAFCLETCCLHPEAEVEHRLELRPGPALGHLAAAPEPGGGPRPPPAAAHVEGLVLLGPGDVVRHGFAGCVPGLDDERHPAPVHVREHPLPQLSLDPLLHQHPVVVHSVRLEVGTHGVGGGPAGRTAAP